MLVAGLCDVASAARGINPVGTWSCVLYGDPEYGDERILLHLAPNGAARFAHLDDSEVTSWVGLAGWAKEDDALRFGDPQTGRLFTADLRRETLGGGWRTVTAVGGWWCTSIDAAEFPEQSESLKPLKPLVPRLTATPVYPIKAIRAAKEGRAVTCFFVGSDGLVVEPELIELSDEMFRAPILSALRRSRYETWEDDGVLRPSCRTYTFKLDSLLHPRTEPDS